MVVSMLVVAGSAFAADSGDKVGHDDTTGHGSASGKETGTKLEFSTEQVAAMNALANKAVETAKAEVANTTAAITTINATGTDAAKLFGGKTPVAVPADNMQPAATYDELSGDLEGLTSDMASNVSGASVFPGAYCPKLEKLADDTAYLICITMDFDTINRSYFSKKADKFFNYPKFSTKKKKAEKGYAIVDGNGKELTPSSVKALGTAGQANLKVYLAFVTAAAEELGLSVAADEVDLDPVLPVMGSATEFKDESDPTTPEKTTPTDPNGPGGGSGAGCAMGTSAMALAVLGAFVAMRKK